MTYYLIAAVGFIFVFGLVVLVHEGGHFFLARLNGVEVKAFSLGMGPTLISYTPNETEYQISLIPLGGYVKLAGEELTEETDNPRAFSNKSVWARISILVAGALCNIILGFALYMPLGIFHGEEILPPKIGFINQDMPAYGELQVGDEVLALNDKRINRFQDITVQNSLLGDATRKFLVLRDGEEKLVEVEPYRVENRSVFEPTHLVGISPYMPSVIGWLGEDSPFKELGIEEGDRVVRIGDQDIESWQLLTRALFANRGDVEIEFLQNSDLVSARITIPTDDAEWQQWVHQLQWGPPVEQKRYGLIGSLSFAARETNQAIRLLFQGLWGLLTGRLSPEGLAGPVGIIGVTGHMATVGFWPLISFAAFLSINLGVINILPIPVLDGGHIMLSIPELFGRRLPPRVFEIANTIGLVFLLGLLIFVTFIDLSRFEFLAGLGRGLWSWLTGWI